MISNLTTQPNIPYLESQFISVYGGSYMEFVKVNDYKRHYIVFTYSMLSECDLSLSPFTRHSPFTRKNCDGSRFLQVLIDERLPVETIEPCHLNSLAACVSPIQVLRNPVNGQTIGRIDVLIQYNLRVAQIVERYRTAQEKYVNISIIATKYKPITCFANLTRSMSYSSLASSLLTLRVITTHRIL